MDLENAVRKLLGLPTKEDKLRKKGIELVERMHRKTYMMSRIPQLTAIMENEVTPRLSVDIRDLEAVGMLDEIIDEFEIMMETEPNVSNILSPLYDIRSYAYEKNGIK